MTPEPGLFPGARPAGRAGGVGVLQVRLVQRPAPALGVYAVQRGRPLADRGFAVWHGDYYAIEVMKRLGLNDGALRVGIVHYNTEDEVDRLLEAL